MLPKELAAKHPRLYHVTRPMALPSIKQHGLLSASNLLSLFEVSGTQRTAIESEIRPISVDISHPIHGHARLTDNLPLSNTVLTECLDDGLSPQDWMRLLNQRVFFWVNEKDVDSHLRASIKHGDKRVVLILDTLTVAEAYLEQIELAAINTGSTVRRAARRGRDTFSPAHLHSYREWQKLRGGNDQLKELTVVGGIQDIDKHLMGYYAFPHLDPNFKRALAAIQLPHWSVN